MLTIKYFVDVTARFGVLGAFVVDKRRKGGLLTTSIACDKMWMGHKNVQS